MSRPSLAARVLGRWSSDRRLPARLGIAVGWWPGIVLLTALAPTPDPIGMGLRVLVLLPVLAGAAWLAARPLVGPAHRLRTVVLVGGGAVLLVAGLALRFGVPALGVPAVAGADAIAAPGLVMLGLGLAGVVLHASLRPGDHPRRVGDAGPTTTVPRSAGDGLAAGPRSPDHRGEILGLDEARVDDRDRERAV